MYGGYENFVKNLSERLVSKNYEVVVYCHSFLFKRKPKKLNGIKLNISQAETKKKNFSQLSHSFLSIIHASFSNSDIVLVVNSGNGPFGMITKIFRKIF